jgi:hypothetical protein
MYLVVRRGAFENLSRAGELTGAAAVACVRRFSGDAALEAWRPRPGKVVLRARGGQWAELLDGEERKVVVGDAVAGLPPRRRSQRGPLLERMQAMTSSLEPPPHTADADPAKLTYLVNPRVEMSSGKTLAQIAHAAVMAAETEAAWVDDGCPARAVRTAVRERRAQGRGRRPHRGCTRHRYRCSSAARSTLTASSRCPRYYRCTRKRLATPT